MTVHCSCGNGLVSEEAICEVCDASVMPYGPPSKEGCSNMAALEGDQEIGAGCLASNAEPNVIVEAQIRAVRDVLQMQTWSERLQDDVVYVSQINDLLAELERMK